MFYSLMSLQKLMLVVLFAIFSTLCLAQSKNGLSGSNSKPEIGIEEINFGIQAGFHSPDLSGNGSLKFNRGFYLESYLGYNLSYEVQVIIAFSYWEGKIDQINSASTQIPSQTVISKSLKMELDFALFNIYSVQVLFGPSISIENINTASQTVFTLGANLKFKIPLSFLVERLRLVALIDYQNGAESFNFGGGTHYSFFGYLLGAEIGF